MRAFDRIPVVLDAREIASRLRLEAAGAAAESDRSLVRLAETLIGPKAVFAACDVGPVGMRTVEIGGIEFVGPALRENLGKAGRVFPYIVTVGPELERAAQAQADLLRQYYLEEIADYALERAAAWLAGYLQEHYGLSGLSSLSPGSLEDWPITEQPKLFSLLSGAERLIGVHLTDGMMMVPRKSISGILFPSDEGFSACQLCEREHCQGRKAPYRSPE